jgi:hypothetical protein
MYVLTEGWYEDETVTGVVYSEDEARDWERDNQYRSYYGPFEPGMPEA